MRSGETRGFTIIEVIISLAVLLVGMLGLIHLQVFGLTSNQGARAHTTAAGLARELATALEALPPNDALISPMGSVGATAPTPFGALLSGTTVASSGFRDMSTTGASALPGVTPEAALELDPVDPSKRLYQRRWTVWGLRAADSITSAPSTLVIAVSVVYRERTLRQPREVLLYVNRANPIAVTGNIAAFE